MFNNNGDFVACSSKSILADKEAIKHRRTNFRKFQFLALRLDWLARYTYLEKI